MSWTSERRIHALFRHAKEQPTGWRTALPVILNGHQAARLEPVTLNDHGQPPLVELLSRWREAAQDSFPTQFRVTLEGTRNWLTNHLFGVPDRILYWIRGDQDGIRLGHVGLFHLNATTGTIELDNVVRGVQTAMPGLMEASVRTLMHWTAGDVGLGEMSLRVFADNDRAVRLYERLGFCVAREIPLVKIVEPEVVSWVEQSEHPTLRSDRRFLEMRRRIGKAVERSLPQRMAA